MTTEKDPLSSYFEFEKATRGQFKPGQRLDGIARSVLLQMASHRHWASRGPITTKAETIATETGFSERTVADRVGRLEQAGWLVRLRGKQGGTVEYDLAVVTSTSAPRAELDPVTSAPRAERLLHHAQKNSALEPVGSEHVGAVPVGPAERAAVIELVAARLDADQGIQHDNPIVAKAVSMESPFPGCFPAGLDEATGVDNSERVLLVLDAVLIAQHRLPQPMKPEQIAATVTMLLDQYPEVDDERWQAMGIAAEWNEVRKVIDPVLLIVGSFRAQIEKEAGHGAVAGH